MNINSLEAEFIRDLEGFLTSPPLPIEPGMWNPKATAAPERHLANGAAEGILFGTQVFQLKKQNYPFELIESVLGIVYDLHKLFGKPVDPEKEQVWLFCYKWLSLYYTTLTEENVMYSDFYRKNHDKFLELLGSGLTLFPEKRKKFKELLETWPCHHSARSAEVISETAASAAATAAASAAAASAAAATAAATAAAAAASGAATAKEPLNEHPQVPAPHHRLVLKRPHGPEAHKKTRRNRCNSDHSHQSGNPILPAQGGK